MPLQETCFLCDDGQILSQKKIKSLLSCWDLWSKVSCGEPSSNLRKETTLEKETGEKGRKGEGFGGEEGDFGRGEGRGRALEESFFREGHREVGRHHLSPGWHQLASFDRSPICVMWEILNFIGFEMKIQNRTFAQFHRVYYSRSLPGVSGDMDRYIEKF